MTKEDSVQYSLAFFPSSVFGLRFYIVVSNSINLVSQISDSTELAVIYPIQHVTVDWIGCSVEVSIEGMSVPLHISILLALLKHVLSAIISVAFQVSLNSASYGWPTNLL